MASPQFEPAREPASQPQRAGAHPVWYVAMAVALVAIVGLYLNARGLSNDLAGLRQTSQDQIAKLSEDLAQRNAVVAQKADAYAQEAADSAKALEARTNTALRRNSSAFSAKLAEQARAQEDNHQAVTGQITDLKTATDSRFDQVSSDVGSVKTDVGTVRSDLTSTQSTVDQHGSDLKRVTGDMGVMSDRIATNATELGQLRQLGERNYEEFDISRKTGLKKVGTIQIALTKADPKRNRFTVNVQADDKLVQKRDRTINEPVQLYVSGNRQPYEIVINQVKKDEIIGYVAIPKVFMSRNAQAEK